MQISRWENMLKQQLNHTDRSLLTNVKQVNKKRTEIKKNIKQKMCLSEQL